MSQPDLRTEALLKIESLNELVVFNGRTWDLSHLRSWGYTNDEVGVYVQVVFTSHCFTRKPSGSELAAVDPVPVGHWYRDRRETRVLDEARYELSRRYLPQLIRELGKRDIRLADERRQNFVTVEVLDTEGRRAGFYSVFFEVRKERKRRLVLRVQSAYLRDELPHREKQRKKVRLATILKRTLEGKTIKS